MVMLKLGRVTCSPALNNPDFCLPPQGRSTYLVQICCKDLGSCTQRDTKIQVLTINVLVKRNIVLSSSVIVYFVDSLDHHPSKSHSYNCLCNEMTHGHSKPINQDQECRARQLFIAKVKGSTDLNRISLNKKHAHTNANTHVACDNTENHCAQIEKATVC
jgi:hypothetical protein